MELIWSDLLAAFALVMVIEGMIPFVNPGLLRRLLEITARLDDRSLRVTGLVSMAGGLAMLYLVRG